MKWLAIILGDRYYANNLKMMINFTQLEMSNQGLDTPNQEWKCTPKRAKVLLYSSNRCFYCTGMYAYTCTSLAACMHPICVLIFHKIEVNGIQKV